MSSFGIDFGFGKGEIGFVNGKTPAIRVRFRLDRSKIPEVFSEIGQNRTRFREIGGFGFGQAGFGNGFESLRLKTNTGLLL